MLDGLEISGRYIFSLIYNTKVVATVCYIFDNMCLVKLDDGHILWLKEREIKCIEANPSIDLGSSMLFIAN